VRGTKRKEQEQELHRKNLESFKQAKAEKDKVKVKPDLNASLRLSKPVTKPATSSALNRTTNLSSTLRASTTALKPAVPKTGATKATTTK
jgi:hypothetical protein